MPEQKRELKTVFEYGGNQYKLKSPSLLFRAKGEAYQTDVVNFAMDFTARSKARLLEVIPEAMKELETLSKEVGGYSDGDLETLADNAQALLNEGKYKEFDELLKSIQERLSGKSKGMSTSVLAFIDALNAFNADMEAAEEIWFNNPENVKRLFDIALDGELEKINHNPDTDDKILAYDSFVEEVSNNFFMRVNSLRKKSSMKTRYSANLKSMMGKT